MSMTYESRLQQVHERTMARNTRQAENYIFEINRVNSVLYSRSPYYVGSTLWNGLPKNTQDLNTKEQFKSAILDRL